MIKFLLPGFRLEKLAMKKTNICLTLLWPSLVSQLNVP